jgi:hypothetical protein
MKSKSGSRSMASAPSPRWTLFGQPQLLEGEDAAAYHQLHARICAVVQPVDIIEEIFIADVVSLEWEARGVHACLRRVAGCATSTGFAGYAGTATNVKLTFKSDHSVGADQWPRVRFASRGYFLHCRGDKGQVGAAERATVRTPLVATELNICRLINAQNVIGQQRLSKKSTRRPSCFPGSTSARPFPLQTGSDFLIAANKAATYRSRHSITGSCCRRWAIAQH